MINQFAVGHRDEPKLHTRHTTERRLTMARSVGATDSCSLQAADYRRRSDLQIVLRISIL
jgi:hypothetical protein